MLDDLETDVLPRSRNAAGKNNYKMDSIRDDNRNNNKEQIGANCFMKHFNSVFPFGWKKDALDLVKLSLPIIGNFLLMIFPQFTSVIMNGHRNRIEQSAVFLANSVINTFVVVPLEGFGIGTGTFYSQIYGSGNLNRLSLILKRSCLIIICITIPIMCLLVNIEGFLVAIGQQNLIAKITSTYLLICIPGLYFYAIATALVPFLQSQNKVTVPLIFSLVQNFFNVVTQGILLFVFHYDYRASAVSTAASYGVNALLLISYFKFSKVLKFKNDKPKGDQKWAIIMEWKEILKLGIPGIVLMGFGVLASEIISIISGYISSVEMGATAMAYQTSAFMLMFFIGLGTAVSIRVGQYLGAGQPQRAAAVVRIALSISLSFALTTSIIFIPLRKHVASLFSSDSKVIARGSELLVAICVMLGVDAVNEIFVCTLRGCGRQQFAAITLVLIYYGIGMPVGIPLALFTEFKIMGLWIAYASSLALVACIYGVVIFRIDWYTLSREAIERATGEQTTIGSTNSAAANSADDSKRSSCEMDNEAFVCEDTSEGVPLVNEDDREADGLHIAPIPRKALLEKCFAFLLLLLLLLTSLMIRIWVPIYQRPMPCSFLGGDSTVKYFRTLNITCHNTTGQT